MSDAPSSWGSLLAGATAATVVDGIIFPLDTIKTRSQAAGGLIQNGGYKGLYRGLGSVAVCTIPSASIFFFSYETFKSQIPLPGSSWNHLAASSLAESLSCAVLTPAEIIKQRAQVSKSGRADAWRGILRDLVRGRDGRALVNGYVGLLGRNVPVTAIQFVLYETFKTRMRRYKAGTDHQGGPEAAATEAKRVHLSAIESGACAGASGSIAAAVTTPMDVIKTRVMLSQSGPDAKTSGGMVTTGVTIFKKEGGRALFKGIGVRVVWTSLGLSLYLGSYEAMKNYIDG